MFRITDISQAKKNSNRVNLFLDDEFWVSLTKTQLVALGLYKGQEINEFEKETIEKANVDGKLLEKVMKWLSLRPRSEKEAYEYLRFKRNISEAEANDLVDYLINNQFLDDKQFAEWFVQNRVEFKFTGPHKIKNELYQKGITGSVVDTLVKKYYPEKLQREKIEKYLEKKRISEIDEKIQKNLIARGFDYSVIGFHR